MKLLFFFFSLLLFSVAYGQVSIQELISVSKMDSEGFEIYAMNKGFSFNNLKNNENIEGISMYNGKIGNERYLIWYSRYFTDKYASNYQTSNKSELAELYKEIGSLGFKLDSREGTEEFYNKSYSRGKEKLDIFIFQNKNWVEISYYYE